VAATKRKHKGGPPRKDLAASRAVARHKATGEPLAACAKAEGIAAQTAYNELNRLELVAAIPATRSARLAASTLPHEASEESEPTDDEIASVDTLEVARSILIILRKRFKVLGDGENPGPLAEKILSAVARIEQIEKNRPRPPAPDEVTRRLVEVRDKAIERFAILAREAVGK
jgi:hypothetical protein